MWSDNDEYEDHRHYLTRDEFEDEYEVITWALEVGKKLQNENTKSSNTIHGPARTNK